MYSYCMNESDAMLNQKHIVICFIETHSGNSDVLQLVKFLYMESMCRTLQLVDLNIPPCGPSQQHIF